MKYLHITASFLLSCLFVCMDVSAQVQAPNVCQNVVGSADVVIMVDITSSQSSTEIGEEKAAVQSFLNAFSGPAYVERPHVAVGTFNHDCSYDRNTGTLTCSGDPARILPNSSLTDDYGAIGGSPDLTDDVAAITGQGFLGNGLGATNIEEALKRAQLELNTNGDPARPDYIILISDGDPNLPGYNGGICNDCTCPEAENAASSYASSIESTTSIIAVHFRGSLIPCAAEGGQEAGYLYMRDEMATSPDLFGTGANLAVAFNAIVDDLVCDDQDACTTDICNPQTSPASCEYTPDTTDSDQDGVPDCLDRCPNGDDSLIGEVCSTGIGQCQSEGEYICQPNGGILCTAIAGDVSDEICDGLDNDCDGIIDNGLNCEPDCEGVPGGSATLDICNVCNGDGTSCLDCSEIDVSELLFSLDSNALQQKQIVDRELARLDRLRPNASRIQSFIDETAATANGLYTESWQQTWTIPVAIESCGNTDLCTEVDVTSDVSVNYLENSAEFQLLFKQTLRKVKKAAGRIRRNDRRLRRRMNSLVKENEEIVDELPQTESVCLP